MNIWLQRSALIQPRTSILKFDHLAEKSENDSIPNLLTKVPELRWRYKWQQKYYTLGSAQEEHNLTEYILAHAAHIR